MDREPAARQRRNAPEGGVMMTEGPRKKRGRPQRVVSSEIARELTAEDVALYEATRNRGGRPADPDNQSLLEIANDAQRRGISLRAGVKEFIEKHGRDATQDEVARCERQINRLRRRLRQGRALVGASNEKLQ